MSFNATNLHCRKKVYHPSSNYNFKSSCQNLIIFGTVIAEYAIKMHWITGLHGALPLSTQYTGVMTCYTVKQRQEQYRQESSNHVQQNLISKPTSLAKYQ